MLNNINKHPLVFFHVLVQKAVTVLCGNCLILKRKGKENKIIEVYDSVLLDGSIFLFPFCFLIMCFQYTLISLISWSDPMCEKMYQVLDAKNKF